MSFWDRLVGRFRKRSIGVSDQLLEALERAAAGYGGDSSLKCTPILSGVRLLGETAAQVPLKTFERMPDGRREAVEHPVYDLLQNQPNAEWTSFEWRERMMFDAVIYGDHFGQLILDAKNNVREIWPLDQDRMEVKRDSDGNIWCGYRREDGSIREFRPGPRGVPEEILHLPLMKKGLRGRSLVELAGRAIGLAINAQEFAARFFENDASPRLILKTPVKLGPEAEKNLKAELKANHGGVMKAHGVMVLSGAAEIEVLQHDIEKMQLRDTRKFQVSEVARVLRIPPHLLFDLDRSTNNNIEHQGIEFLVFTAAPWFRRIEQRLNMTLFGPREGARFYAEFEPDGLVRADYKSRIEGMAAEINNALMQPNEGRRMLNRPPRPGGDQLLVQGAMIPLESAGKQQQQQGATQ